MKTFRFAILGAARIAVKFCQAVSLIEGCEVCAVASKSRERAQAFAERNHLARYYDSYAQMLEEEKPDCAYIAVTPHDHARLSMLCLEKGVPVLCEKAMFQNGAEAKRVFDEAKRRGLFVMEAMWSRFLPAMDKAKEWLGAGKIGKPEVLQCAIGFCAPQDPENRYMNPALGGGAARDVTVYAYEIATHLMNKPVKRTDVSVVWGETGVDMTDQVTLHFGDAIAGLTTTFSAQMEERLTVYGRGGKIVLPMPHHPEEAFLYDAQGKLCGHFTDTETKNGFTYEIEECIRCIRAGETQSPVVPWKDTADCAALFDQIDATKREE